MALLVTLVLSRLFIPDSYLFAAGNRTGFFALFGLSNIQLIWEHDSYFGTRAEFNPYIHTWSLGVEEQFYFIFPLVLFLTFRLRFGSSPVATRCARQLLPALLLLSLGFCSWETTRQPERAYFLLTSRFWELAAGSILCLAHSRNHFLPRSPGQSLAIALAGLASIGASLFFTDKTLFPFPWAIAPVLGSVCCISGFAVPSHLHLARQLLSLKPVTYIGRISYSLYLWHWPVIVLMRWTAGIESLLQITIAIVVTGMLGSLSYHVIEKPFQRLKLFRDQWVQFVLCEESSSTAGRRLPYSLPTNVVLVLFGLSIIWASSYVFRRIERSRSLPLSVTMRVGPNPWQQLSTDKPDGSFVKGKGNGSWSNRAVFVIGDSHATMYTDMICMLREQRGVSTYLFSEPGFKFGSLVNVKNEANRLSERRIFSDLKTYAKPGDVVLLGALRVRRLCTQWAKLDLKSVVMERDSEEAEETRRLAVREGCELIRALEDMGLVVVIAAPTPVFLSPPFRCSDWFNRMNPIGDRGFLVRREFLINHRSAAMRSIKEVQNEHPHVRVWDPFWVLCPDSTCSVFDGDKPLVFDGDHLSSYANQKLYPHFVQFLATIWGDSDSQIAPCRR